MHKKNKYLLLGAFFLTVFFWHDCYALSKSKFLVTGGCGFIGSHLVDALIEEGHDVLVLDDLSTGKTTNLHPKATLIKGTITDKKLLTAILSQHQDIAGCFHLAAVASVLKSNQEWLQTHQVNGSGTVTVFEQAAHFKVPVVYASSAAVYGDKDAIHKESDTPKPQTAYAVDKYGCELYARVAYGVHNLSSIGFRFFNVYGPRQDTSPYSGVIAIFAKKLIENQPLLIDGDGKQTRDFIYVKDVVKALIAGMTKLKTHLDICEVYNVCTGKGTSLLDLVAVLEEVVGHPATHYFRKNRRGDIKILIGSSEKFYHDFHLKPEVSLREGVRLTWESYQSKPLPKEIPHLLHSASSRKVNRTARSYA